MTESVELGTNHNGALQGNLLPALANPSQHRRQTLGLATLRELETSNQSNPQTFVIDGLIAEKSVNIAVGDSGEGKSPLGFQMAVCVAAGLPFLGRATKKGPVIYIDLENGTADVLDMVSRLAKHLSIPPPYDDLSRSGASDTALRLLGVSQFKGFSERRRR